MQEMIQVLLIEDNPGDKRLIQHMLLDVAPDQAPAPYTLVWHATLAAGLDWVLNHRVDIVLLDLSLPDNHVVCSTLVTCTSTSWLIKRRPFSTTTIVPSSR